MLNVSKALNFSSCIGNINNQEDKREEIFLGINFRNRRVKVRAPRALLAKYRLQTLGGSDGFKPRESNIQIGLGFEQDEIPIFLIQKPYCFILSAK